MRPEYYNLISCHHCKEPFSDNDEICTIVSRKFDNFNKAFTTQITAVKVETSRGIFDVPSIERSLNFHRDCFCEIAGEDYLP